MTDHQQADSGDAPPGHLVRQPAPGGSQEDQFRAFYMDQVPRLVSMLMALGASLDLATDLVQETMIVAFRRWTAIRNPFAWVRKVARRKLYAHFGRSRHNSGIQVDAIHDGQLLLRSSSSIDEWVARHAILEVLAGLPSRQREVMTLTLDGHQPAEIADMIGIEPQAVRASLLKARRAVRKRLSGEVEQ